MLLLLLASIMLVSGALAFVVVRRAARPGAVALAVVLGLFAAAAALLIGGHDGALGVDESVAAWTHAHARPGVTDALHTFTDLGKPGTVIVLAVVFGLLETLRTRDRWTIPFLLAVVGGNALVTTLVKNLADRVRPDFDPLAALLGPSFPSGHSSYSAAFFAAAAMLLARGRSRAVQSALAGGAVALAVGVATSRVLLDAHWLSDVLAGLALGWSWLALCVVAFRRQMPLGQLEQPDRVVTEHERAHLVLDRQPLEVRQPALRGDQREV